MRDYLLDLIQHTCSLGFIDLIKVTGTDKSTIINAVADDNTVIVQGVFHQPQADFVGVYGMPNLNKLKTILKFEDYDANSSITMVRNQDDTPNSIHFETANRDFVNDYRLMSELIVKERVKSVKFAGANWNIQFEPKLASIQRLKRQWEANHEENNFVLKQEGTDLKIYMGNVTTHSGNFVFEHNVSGKVTKSWSWPVKQFVKIMDLPGNKMIFISDSPAMRITVDSGLANYEYMLPAQS
jgi:hypothetical protein